MDPYDFCMTRSLNVCVTMSLEIVGIIVTMTSSPDVHASTRFVASGQAQPLQK